MAMRLAIANVRRRLGRRAPLLLVCLLPAALLGVGIARLTLNHFFGRAPYLLDSGFLSAIAYRDGVLLPVPAIACDYADVFYEIYVTPLMSLFSLISYLVPLDRIEWYAVVQGCVHLPVAICVYVLASRIEPATATRRVWITALAAVAFASSGIVVWTIGYPHFEIATAGLVCVLLACVVTERRRATWAVLLLVASVRQDSGAHAALALSPLLFLRWRGVTTVPPRNRILAVMGAAIGLSLLSFVVQRIFLEPADRLHEVYFGRPIYGHVTPALLLRRLHYIGEHLELLYYPVLATAFIAALTRDARYLLGWAITLPWFAFNLLARDDAKGTFLAYTVAPFLVGLFWVYVYGARLAPVARRLSAMRAEALFAIVCLTSTLGYARQSPGWSHDPVRDMVFSLRYDRTAIHRFVEMMAAHRAELGRLAIDDSVAAIALEAVRPGDLLQPGTTEVDTLAFHRRAWGLRRYTELAVTEQLSCSRIVDTGIVVCSRLPAVHDLLSTMHTVPFDPEPRHH